LNSPNRTNDFSYGGTVSEGQLQFIWARNSRTMYSHSQEVNSDV
jgi:hypothetical protein